jgi:preprotein translocase subunit YajC
MLLTLFLQANTGSSWFQFVPLAGIAVVFYFLIFRPQQKRQKEQAEFKTSLKVGDKVVTIGGLHGKVTELKDDLVVLEVDRATKLTFDRTSISAESTKRVQAAATATA